MKKASIIMAGLACAMIAAAYTNSVPISTNTRAATEKWTAIRFEPALPPTPENAASKFLDGNREWQTVSAAQIGALTNETDEAALAALAAYAAYWPRNATASSWFTFTTNSGAITITGYNIAGGTDVVIPDYIDGLPVTEIGANAFAGSEVTSIGGAGNVVTVGDYAFSDCLSLTSVSLPQAQTVGSGAFGNCDSLASIPLPQAQMVGSVAFFDCFSLASLYFDSDAPTIGTDIFGEIPPNQVTIYVTNPTATGWGATFAGMPVVRLPLYADAITLNGDTITEWPVGGGETSIIAPLYDSGTNVTVTSTQSVYSVAVTGAGPVGIDWSGLALDGTGRAEVTLRLNVTEWGGTNVAFSPAMTFDRTPEILVTGVWEFAASTVDGVTTRVRQTWPECCGYSFMVDTSTSLNPYLQIDTEIGGTNNWSSQIIWTVASFVNIGKPIIVRLEINNDLIGRVGTVIEWSLFASFSTAYTTHLDTKTITGTGVRIVYFSFVPTSAMKLGDQAGLVLRGINLTTGAKAYPRIFRTASYRFLNANERAAYEAGWRP